MSTNPRLILLLHDHPCSLSVSCFPLSIYPTIDTIFNPYRFRRNFASREQKSGREWVFKILFLWVVKS